MILRRLSLLSLLMALVTTTAFAADPVPAELLPKPVELWPQGAPGATGQSDEDRPAIYSFLPAADKNTGAAVLVCPGGGFTTRCMDFEGVQICQWLKAHGVAGIALRYRIGPLYTRRDSIADAHRAMQYIRAHAKELAIAPDRIGIIGFSAGASLAGGTTFETPAAKPDSNDPLDRLPTRPNFLILAYGSAPLPAQNADAPPGDALPPTFMFCTAEDAGALGGMTTLLTGLRSRGSAVEVHIFRSGEHGVGFAQGDPNLGTWPDLVYSWMRAGGFLTGKERVPLKGIVKLDGEPLPRGAVIFTPVDAPGAPAVIGYVFNTGAVRGQFDLAAPKGPVPGRYRVEVRQVAARWLSNAQNPMARRFGEYRNRTDDQKKEIAEYARKRDLSASLENERVYRKARPTDKEELIVEIKPGGSTDLGIEVFSK